jgi:primosomal protein N' (replication factor Y)
MYAEVAVDIPGSSRGTFSYGIPDGMDVREGHAVWVPFGPRVRRGLVFAISEVSQVETVRPIARLLNETPLLARHQIELATWVAEYYRSNLFTAASPMLPPGFADTLRTYVASGPTVDASGLSERHMRAIALVSEADRLRKTVLARKFGRGGVGLVDSLVRSGHLVESTVWDRPKTAEATQNYVILGTTAPEALELADAQRSKARGDLLRFMVESEDGYPRPELTGRFGQSAVSGLIKSGLLSQEKRRVERNPLSHYQFQRSFSLDPTAPQAEAIKQINERIDANSPGKPFLLYGVTGSGKTEVYLQAAQKALDKGRGVIVLVPEIALTPQNLARFASRFPGQIALLHSGLADGERFDQWWGVHRGEYKVVLGSRGAIFAPVRNLGLIIIDEEHEWTYKQSDASPRYDSRRVAEQLAALTGCTQVAGSATPDVGDYRGAERGDWRLLTLPDRVVGSPESLAPLVKVVDMRQELRDGHTGMFSRALLQHMDRVLDGEGRVILFLNRRGSASHVQCRNCGYSRRCSRCDSNMTYHRADNGVPAALICHYCNRRIRYTNACPMCHEHRVAPSGTGTQAVVDEVDRIYPRAGTIRWDRDVARTAKAHEAILSTFLNGNERVLVGTQMVAKGLDIPSVELVGVISADTALSIPDFRSGEKAFQILTQVAGRAGRGNNRGDVIMQTFQPDHYAIQAAVEQDFDAFYRTEIKLRRSHANPPFTSIVRLGISDPNADTAQSEAFEFADLLRRASTASGIESVQILGPSPSFPMRMRGVHRWHILLKGSSPLDLLDQVQLPHGWSVDVDPVSVA